MRIYVRKSGISMYMKLTRTISTILLQVRKTSNYKRRWHRTPLSRHLSQTDTRGYYQNIPPLKLFDDQHSMHVNLNQAVIMKPLQMCIFIHNFLSFCLYFFLFITFLCFTYKNLQYIFPPIYDNFSFSLNYFLNTRL